ncbi:DNA cytosine methyltransferase [Methylophilus sp. QUAN]|uniref:DNA cytosine methyltransferase n=1 Tax=Methylophilus sp. QUAN TaxID=2781020 RepID=UPI00189056AF|nr:DNA cytosine methyltransferase [Methylophilus sp. QUAN]MBF4990658.1 DNA cytosine methyltransferase [Methylophilus sp. QUAN]
MNNSKVIKKTIRHFHMFCGLGAGAKGFNQASARVGNLVGEFECLGGIDVDPAAIKDFKRLTGVDGTVMDLFDRDQYIAFHGREPDSHWREATTADIKRAAGNQRPHIIFLSAPCKGFSGLLNETKSKSDKYQALNRLTLRGVWLMLEAWADDLPELIVFENVPRIATRGRHLLDQITSMLRQYGYAVAETTHDCGELGGLAQSRKRFLLVARQTEKVPPFLYEPQKKSLQSVGTILGRMPIPGDIAGGPMHRIPNLQWKTWVRLAFVEAGSDWRSLNKLAVEDGVLRDYLIVPEFHHGYLGVNKWEDHTGTVAGRSMPSNGAFSIADPRYQGHEYSQYGVLPFDKHIGTVSAQSAPGGGTYSVADPRSHTGFGGKGKYIITSFDKNANTVIAASTTGRGAFAVADPRGGEDPAKLHGKYHTAEFEQTSHAVIAGNANGAYAVADPRPTNQRSKGDNYLTNGHYGVVPFDEHCGAVSAAAGHDNGRWSVADPRLPAVDEKMVCVIRALDDTWHRPFTTLELAALQSIIEPEEFLELEGLSDQAWRERIGNAVPPKAGKAIAEVMGTTLLLAWSGETFVLSATPIWVRPVAVALSLSQEGLA